ncbi:hypothetical protein ADUPG1_006481 [Aduncisulcus paluster]|uniref:Protein kinase domain-containing protein n=1 Tax=Aduncisulcus paluster TaxID=2918883 RepID=A0ABQ5KIG1_9EUKA|nr:hypothetical protein ADUPG1_006481 [Aduncisulcus paluster]
MFDKSHLYDNFHYNSSELQHRRAHPRGIHPLEDPNLNPQYDKDIAHSLDNNQPVAYNIDEISSKSSDNPKNKPGESNLSPSIHLNNSDGKLVIKKGFGWLIILIGLIMFYCLVVLEDLIAVAIFYYFDGMLFSMFLWYYIHNCSDRGDYCIWAGFGIAVACVGFVLSFIVIVYNKVNYKQSDGTPLVAGSFLILGFNTLPAWTLNFALILIPIMIWVVIIVVILKDTFVEEEILFSAVFIVNIIIALCIVAGDGYIRNARSSGGDDRGMLEIYIGMSIGLLLITVFFQIWSSKLWDEWDHRNIGWFFMVLFLILSYLCLYFKRVLKDRCAATVIATYTLLGIFFGMNSFIWCIRIHSSSSIDWNSFGSPLFIFFNLGFILLCICNILVNISNPSSSFFGTGREIVNNIIFASFFTILLVIGISCALKGEDSLVDLFGENFFLTAITPICAFVWPLFYGISMGTNMYYLGYSTVPYPNYFEYIFLGLLCLSWVCFILMVCGWRVYSEKYPPILLLLNFLSLACTFFVIALWLTTDIKGMYIFLGISGGWLFLFLLLLILCLVKDHRNGNGFSKTNRSTTSMLSSGLPYITPSKTDIQISEPSEPSESSKHWEPSEPSESPKPIEPSDSLEPIEPSEPIDSSESSKHSTPPDSPIYSEHSNLSDHIILPNVPNPLEQMSDASEPLEPSDSSEVPKPPEDPIDLSDSPIPFPLEPALSVNPPKLPKSSKQYTLDDPQGIEPLCIIGQGGFGEVLLVEIPDVQEPCIFKKMLRQADKKLIKECKKEFSTLRKLYEQCSERIPKPEYIFNFLDDSFTGVFGFSMEFCRGGNISEFAREWCVAGKDGSGESGDESEDSDSDSSSSSSSSSSSDSGGPDDRAILSSYDPLRMGSICVATIECLDDIFTAMHVKKRKFTHRDIKPENFLVRINPETDECKVVLGDLGLAKLQNSLSKSSEMNKTVCGTLVYNAPEALEGHHDESSDAYSLGMTIFALFNGSPPFLGMPIFRSAGNDSTAIHLCLMEVLGARDPMIPGIDHCPMFLNLKKTAYGKKVFECLKEVYNMLVMIDPEDRMTIHDARLKVQSIKRYLPVFGDGIKCPSIKSIIEHRLKKNDEDTGSIL